MLAVRERVPLPDVLEEHPPNGGAIEVLGYIQIANDDRHEVDEMETSVIHLPGTSENSPNLDLPNDIYEIPKVTFLSPRLHMMRDGLQTGAPGS